MAIVETVIDSIHGDLPQRGIYYRCRDDSGEWHDYGPVIVSDASFDAEAYKAVAAARVAEQLAEAEFRIMLA